METFISGWRECKGSETERRGGIKQLVYANIDYETGVMGVEQIHMLRMPCINICQLDLAPTNLVLFTSSLHALHIVCRLNAPLTTRLAGWWLTD